MFEWFKNLVNKIMPKKEEVKAKPKAIEGCDYFEFHTPPSNVVSLFRRIHDNMSTFKQFFECYNAKEKHELTTERLRGVNFNTVKNYIDNRYKVSLGIYARATVYQSSKLNLAAHFTKEEIDSNSDNVRTFRIAMTTPNNKVRKFSSCFIDVTSYLFDDLNCRLTFFLISCIVSV